MRKYLLEHSNYFYRCMSHSYVEPMAIIGNFLIDDVGDGRFFREWVYDDSREVTGGNITWLSKTDKRTIRLEDKYTDDENYFIEMSKEQFLKMLDDWKKMRILKPPYILVSQDDHGNINFQPLEQPADVENK